MKKTALVFLLSLGIAFAGAVPTGLADRVLSAESPESEVTATVTAVAIFDIGVEVGIVERGTLDGVAPASLVPHLVRIRELVATAAGDRSSLEESETLIEAMENATESADLHGRIVAFRKMLAARVAGREPVSEPGVVVEAFDCDQGSWEGVWKTTWGDMTLVFEKGGCFHGTYGPSQHSVSGVFDPDHPTVLRGCWNHFGSTATGGIRFEMKAPNRFEGGWSSGIPVEGVGSTWNGTRRRTHHSEILIVPVGEAMVSELRKTGLGTWTQRFLIKKGFSVQGRPADFPFAQIFTFSPENDEWQRCGPLQRIPGVEAVRTGETFEIDLSVPGETARRQMLVEFGREAVADDEDRFLTLRTRPLRLVPPRTSAKVDSASDAEGETSSDEDDELDAPDGGEQALGEGGPPPG